MGGSLVFLASGDDQLSIFNEFTHPGGMKGMDNRDNPRCEARQTVAGAIWETRHWRNVRTA
jgi:hypothetical protein